MKNLSVCRLSLLSLVVFGMSCTSMDYHYEDYWELANRIYVGKVDSVKALPGKNRVKFTWKRSPDPTVSHVMVYWNNKSDSLLIAIDNAASVDSLEIIISGLSEDTHMFELFSQDRDGNRSIPVEVITRVYGDVYEGALVNRVVRDQAIEGDSLIIWWFEDSDPDMIGTEIHYTDVNRADRIFYHPADGDRTAIGGIDFQREITYRSLYRPDSLAIDTFYTSFIPISLQQ